MEPYQQEYFNLEIAKLTLDKEKLLDEKLKKSIEEKQKEKKPKKETSETKDKKK